MANWKLLSTLADPCLHKSYLKDICKVQEKQFGECLKYAKWSRVCNDAPKLMCGVSGQLRQLCLHNYVVKILLAFLEQNVTTILYSFNFKWTELTGNTLLCKTSYISFPFKLQHWLTLWVNCRRSILGEQSVMRTDTLLNRPFFPSLFVKTSFVCPKADTDTKITISWVIILPWHSPS